MDEELALIASPLSVNPTLRGVLERFRDCRRRHEDAAVYDGAAVDAFDAQVEHVADRLLHMDESGGLEEWDWAASFLSDSEFRDLYVSDRHDDFAGFIDDDVRSFLCDPDWMQAAGRLSRGEQANLLTVLSRSEAEGSAVAAHLLKRRLDGI